MSKLNVMRLNRETAPRLDPIQASKGPELNFLTLVRIRNSLKIASKIDPSKQRRFAFNSSLSLKNKIYATRQKREASHAGFSVTRGITYAGVNGVGCGPGDKESGGGSAAFRLGNSREISSSFRFSVFCLLI